LEDAISMSESKRDNNVMYYIMLADEILRNRRMSLILLNRNLILEPSLLKKIPIKVYSSKTEVTEVLDFYKAHKEQLKRIHSQYIQENVSFLTARPNSMTLLGGKKQKVRKQKQLIRSRRNSRRTTRRSARKTASRSGTGQRIKTLKKIRL
jgi:hypothetical protein